MLLLNMTESVYEEAFENGVFGCGHILACA